MSTCNLFEAMVVAAFIVLSCACIGCGGGSDDPDCVPDGKSGVCPPKCELGSCK